MYLLVFRSSPSWVKAPLTSCVKGAIQIIYIIIIIIFVSEIHELILLEIWYTNIPLSL
jgi:hypothetical protein